MFSTKGMMMQGLFRKNLSIATVAALVVLCSSVPAVAANFEEDLESRKWEELEVQLPPTPSSMGLVEIYVSASTDNRFFVDPASVSVGGDGVVRYSLVVLTSAGAKNVTYEGMRCETKERRLYAFGRSDGAWSKARGDKWERIKEAANNRQHAALFQDYFCPGGVIVRSSEEALRAVRQGVIGAERR